MDKDLTRYYEDRFAMFATQGWKDLMEDIAVMLEATDTIAGLQDARELHIRQGEVAQMRWLLGLQSMSEQTYEELCGN